MPRRTRARRQATTAPVSVPNSVDRLPHRPAAAGLLLDCDAGTLTVKKNGRQLGVAASGLTGKRRARQPSVPRRGDRSFPRIHCDFLRTGLPFPRQGVNRSECFRERARARESERHRDRDMC